MDEKNSSEVVRRILDIGTHVHNILEKAVSYLFFKENSYMILRVRS